MERRYDRLRVLRWTVYFGLLLAGGCGGSMRAAVLSHAEASRAVSLSLSRAAAALRCEGYKDEGMAQCKAALEVIETQSQVLRDSADRLQKAAR